MPVLDSFKDIFTIINNQINHLLELIRLVNERQESMDKRLERLEKTLNVGRHSELADPKGILRLLADGGFKKFIEHITCCPVAFSFERESNTFRAEFSTDNAGHFAAFCGEEEEEYEDLMQEFEGAYEQTRRDFDRFLKGNDIHLERFNDYVDVGISIKYDEDELRAYKGFTHYSISVTVLQ